MSVVAAWYQRIVPRLQEQIQYAYERCPAVRERLDGVGFSPADLHAVADLERVPVLPKEELVRRQRQEPPFGGFLAIPLAELKHVFVSPGPLYDPAGAESFHTGEWARELLRSFGLKQGDFALNTYAYHLVPAGLGLDEFLVSVGVTVVPGRSEEHTSELQSHSDLVCRLLLEKKKNGRSLAQLAGVGAAAAVSSASLFFF